MSGNDFQEKKYGCYEFYGRKKKSYVDRIKEVEERWML